MIIINATYEMVHLNNYTEFSYIYIRNILTVYRVKFINIS